MKKIYRLFIFIFFTVLTVNISAADQESCGVKNGSVKEYSYEVCKEDVSFDILYSLFPKFFDESVFILADFGEIEELSETPEYEFDDQYKKFSNLLYEVFTSVSKLSTFILMFYVFYYVFFSILKSSESGSFLDYSGKSITRTLMFSGLIGIMFVPIGGLTLIQVAILIVAILSISIANLTYGQYLSVFDTQIEYITSDEDEDGFLLEKHDSSPSAIMAKAYTKDLARISLCRDITSQAILDQNIYDLKIENIGTRLSCASGELNYSDSITSTVTSKAKSIGLPSFYNTNYSEVFRAKTKSLNINEYTLFGIQKRYTCEVEKFKPYTCGIMESKTPKLGNNNLLKMYGVGNFMKDIISTSEKLNLAGGNTNIFKKDWNSIKKRIEEQLKNASEKTDKEVSFSAKDKASKEVADNIVSGRDMTDLKKMSYLYHQLMLNTLTTGLSIKTLQKSSGFMDVFENDLNSHIDYSNEKALMKDFKDIKEVSNKIQENHCILNSDGLADSYSTLSKLKRTSQNSGGSTRCLILPSYGIYGVDSSGTPLLKKDDTKEKFEKRLSVISELFNEKAEEIFKRRMEVEISFVDSLKGIGEQSVLVNLRKRGWLTMPTYLIEASKDVKTTNIYMKALLGSNKFKPLNVDFSYISNDISSMPDVSFDRYAGFKGNSNIFKYFLDEKQSESIYNDNETFTKSLVQDNADFIIGSDFDFNKIFGNILNPIKPLKFAIGLENVESLTSKDNLSLMEQCKKNRDLCPIPKSDPIIELNKYGHYLMSTSASYFSMLAIMKGLVFGLSSAAKLRQQKKDKSKQDKDENGVGKGKGNKSIKKIGSDVLTSLGGSFKGANLLGDALDITSNILAALIGVVIGLFFVGVFLAYLLPLIPMVYFFVGFLTWVLLIAQILIIAPIWAVHFIKFEENKEIIAHAAKSYGLQILLKPIFMVMGMIFAWEFMKVALFFVNLTIFPLFNSTQGDSTILSFLREVLFLFVFTGILYVIIKYILQIITTIADTLLKTLDIAPNQSPEGQMNEMIQYFLITQAQGMAEKGAAPFIGGDKISNELAQKKYELNEMKGVKLADDRERAIAAGLTPDDKTDGIKEGRNSISPIEEKPKTALEKKKEGASQMVSTGNKTGFVAIDGVNTEIVDAEMAEEIKEENRMTAKGRLERLTEEELEELSSLDTNEAMKYVEEKLDLSIDFIKQEYSKEFLEFMNKINGKE
jgi:hypothetical protein